MRELNTENKIEQISKTEQEMLPSRAAVPVGEWESAVSDTESLVQERAYQHQLQKNLSDNRQNNYTPAQEKNAFCSLSSDDEDSDDKDVEYFRVYDSLEETAHLHAKRLPLLAQSIHSEKREEKGQHLSFDAYSDLRYDPNWRSNLTAASHFKESTVPSVTKYNVVQRNKCSQPCANRHEVVLKGGYNYIADTHPSVVLTSPLAPMQSDQPYHLHPPDCGTGSVILLSDNQFTSKPSSQETQAIPKIIPRKKLEGVAKDVVKRNKVTLGRNKPEHGSYMMVHALKKTPYKTPKVTQIGEEKKEKSTPPQQCPLAPGIRTGQGNGLNFPLEIQTGFTQSKHLEVSPTINVNINLNTLSHLLPFHQRGQAGVINLASLQESPQLISTSEVQVTLSPPHLQKKRAEFSQISQKGVVPQHQNKNMEMSPETLLREAACKGPLSHEGVEKNPGEVHHLKSPQQLLGKPTTTPSAVSGPHTVLPPIGKTLREGGVEMIPGHSVDTAEAPYRSSSDGYLVQMERQKQKGRGTHKASDFTDYKQLKPKNNTQDLGADYKVMEEAAEKLKRRRLYSNVIQEQNKKIRRIPFVLTKDPQSNNKTVPRMKALEYAKTVAKRPVPAQPKQRLEQKSKSVSEHASFLEDLDVFQPAALDVLRRRHEEEKQLVALFKKVHAV